MKPPVTPLPSATVLLIRDGADGIEVLMTARHRDAGFAGGALVFPGGKVCPEDKAMSGTGAADDLHPYRIAAIRETYEECGLLLARRGGELLSARTLDELHATHSKDFPALVQGAALVLADDLLVRFAHWITPALAPKRFDTQFFLASTPSDQVAVHDGHEAVDAYWVTPEAVVRDAEAGKVRMVFVTRLNLLKVGRSRSVAEALDRARRDPIVTVEPQVTETPEGSLFSIPESAGYTVSQALVNRNARA